MKSAESEENWEKHSLNSVNTVQQLEASERVPVVRGMEAGGEEGGKTAKKKPML